jgi:hypothetical protein
MSSGGIIGVQNQPTTTRAGGVWSAREQVRARRDGVWPSLVAFSGSYISSYSTGDTTFTSRTFSAASIGAEHPNRTVVITATWNAGEIGVLLSSATIAGVSATIIQTSASAGWERSAILYANVPSGSSADVVLNFAGTINNGAAIGVFRLIDVTSVSSGYFDAHFNTTTTYSTSVVVPNSNSYVVSTFATGTSTPAWTNTTQRYSYIHINDRHEGASVLATSPGSLNLSVSGNTYGVLTSVVFS